MRYVLFDQLIYFCVRVPSAFSKKHDEVEFARTLFSHSFFGGLVERQAEKSCVEFFNSGFWVTFKYEIHYD